MESEEEWISESISISFDEPVKVAAAPPMYDRVRMYDSYEIPKKSAAPMHERFSIPTLSSKSLIEERVF